MGEPVDFDRFVLEEILTAKANWLGLVCASLLPTQLARLDLPGNLENCRLFLKRRGATVKEFEGRSEVWIKRLNGESVQLAEFKPRLDEDKKLGFDAQIAGLRVDVSGILTP